MVNTHKKNFSVSTDISETRQLNQMQLNIINKKHNNYQHETKLYSENKFLYGTVRYSCRIIATND